MKTVMVVDDELNVLEEVKKCLETDDFEVITADNSKRAFELIEHDKEEDISLILIDTVLPNTKTPAFFSMNPKSKKDIDTTNVEDFLQKPFTKEQLLDFVKSKME